MRKKEIKIPPGIEKEMEERIAEYIPHIPKSSQQRYIRVMKSRSRPAATELKCLECCNWSAYEVSKCTVYTCPLWSIVVAKKISQQIYRKEKEKQ